MVTNFVVIAPGRATGRSRRKSSIIYSTANRPGALIETLNIFAAAGINLVKLE